MQQIKNIVNVEPYVHIEIENNGVLLYNTLNNTTALFRGEPYVEFFKNIDKNENLRVVELDNKIDKSILKSIVIALQENFMGEIHTLKAGGMKPVQMTPLLKIEEYIPDPRITEGHKINSNISDFVEELSVFINNDKANNNSVFFEGAYKQYLTVRKNSAEYEELNFAQIKEIVKEFDKHNLHSINITGSNILNHSDFPKIVDSLNNCSCYKNYYLHFEDFVNNSTALSSYFNQYSTLHIVFYRFKSRMNEINDAIIKSNSVANIQFDFFIDSEEAYNFFEELCESYSFENYQLFPYFNGDNFDFIKECISYEGSHITENTIPMNRILLRDRMNESFFGKVYVTEDGKVYSNLNFSELGNINENTMLEMVYNEINSIKNWSVTRNKVEPCMDCIYKRLCPPISNLECFFGKYNFCND